MTRDDGVRFGDNKALRLQAVAGHIHDERHFLPRCSSHIHIDGTQRPKSSENLRQAIRPGTSIL
jgi:hypothetical protein